MSAPMDPTMQQLADSAGVSRRRGSNGERA